MNLSPNGVKFVKMWEKFRPHAYKDQAGIWTIGYGTTRYMDGYRVKEGDSIEEVVAAFYIIQNCIGISNKLNDWITHGVSQTKFDALVSLTYNIGTDGFKTSTILKCLNSNEEVKEDHFTRWDKVTIDGLHIPSQGLRNRRLSEWKLFSKGVYDVSN